MEPSGAADPAPDVAIRFRAGKKRKAYRQRPGSLDAADPSASTTTAEPTAAAGDTKSHETPSKPARKAEAEAQAEAEVGAQNAPDGRDQEEDEEESESAVAAALRLRNAQRGRRRGVGFGAASRPGAGNSEQGLVVSDPDAAAQEKEAAMLNDVTRRFTHQTGMLRDLDDKHMMEYIESRLSSRTAPSGPTPSRAAEAASSTSTATATASSSAARAGPTAPTAPVPKLRPGQAATQGHLMEVELGDEVRQRNIARTERAAGFGSADPDADDADTNRRAKKPRLGRDGKPWRPRNRRGSDAVKRDQLVEQILHESRLEVYDVPEKTAAGSKSDQGEEATDDKLLQQFQAQFLEDVAKRAFQKKQQQAQQQAQAKQAARLGTEEVLRGPKLGGSRNDRAAIRNALLKKDREGK